MLDMITADNVNVSIVNLFMLSIHILIILKAMSGEKVYLIFAFVQTMVHQVMDQILPLS